MPCERRRFVATSKLVRVQLVSLATAVLRQGLPCEACKQVLRTGERPVPLPLRLNLAEQPLAERVLLVLGQLRGLVEGLLENLGHNRSILPSRLCKCPLGGQHGRLLQYGLRRLLLLIGGIPVLAEDAFHEHAELGTHVLADSPV